MERSAIGATVYAHRDCLISLRWQQFGRRRFRRAVAT